MLGRAVDASVVHDQLAAAREEAEARIRTGRLRSVDDLRPKYPAVWESADAALELIYAEYVLRRANGETPDRADWYTRYPDWSDRLNRLFGLYDLMAGDTHGERQDGTVPGGRNRPADPLPEHPPGYEILGEIGRGGMAVVYRARQVALNRVVAVKVLRGGGWFREGDTARIRREAEAVGRMQHPHVVQIHEVGDWDGEPFLALEYVAGGTLADALARRRRQGTVGLPAVTAAGLVETLARTMQYAHSQGVIHRDLKPANLLLTADPAGPFANPKVADFGLAVAAELDASVFQSAALAGTPCYMAPEQADGRRGPVGPHTDVYALGGILYELLTGRPPFQGATVLETLDLVRNADPVRPRLLRPASPRDLETICLKCLEKEPDRRYPSADALADELARFRDGRPITARPVGVVERGWKWCRRRPLPAGLAGGLLAAVAVAVVLPSFFWQQAEDGRKREAGLRQAAEEGERQQAELRAALEERQTRLLMKTAVTQWKDHDLAAARETLSECRVSDRGPEWATLWRACRPPLATMTLPPVAEGKSRFSPDAMAFSPDGRRLAGKFGGSEVMVWEAADGRHRHTVRGNQSLNGIAFPDADRLVVVAVVTGKSFGPDESGVIASEVDPASGESKPIRTVTRRTPGAVHLSRAHLTGDGRFVVWFARKNQLEVLDLAGGTVRPLAVTDVTFNTFHISPGGNHILTYPQSDKTRVFDPATLTEVRAFDLPEKVKANHSRVLGAVSSDLNRMVLTRLAEGQASELTFRNPGTPAPDRHQYNPADTTQHVTFSPDGRLVACYAGRDKHVGVYHFATGKRLLELRGVSHQVTALAFSPDSTRLAVASTAPSVTIWDVAAIAP